MIALLSAGASWRIAVITTRQTIESEIREGVAVFDNVGYRYFAAIYSIYSLRYRASELRDGTDPFVSDDASWKAYRTIMADMADDIGWLRRNTAFDKVGPNIFPYMQNLMMAEASGVDRKPDPTTLRTNV